jgi:hypothetical protein
LYTTLLRLVGEAADRFNMEKSVAALHDSATGPIEQLLA